MPRNHVWRVVRVVEEVVAAEAETLVAEVYMNVYIYEFI
jgi:hypothetical protein